MEVLQVIQFVTLTDTFTITFKVQVFIWLSMGPCVMIVAGFNVLEGLQWVSKLNVCSIIDKPHMFLAVTAYNTVHDSFCDSWNGLGFWALPDHYCIFVALAVPFRENYAIWESERKFKSVNGWTTLEQLRMNVHNKALIGWHSGWLVLDEWVKVFSSRHTFFFPIPPLYTYGCSNRHYGVMVTNSCGHGLYAFGGTNCLSSLQPCTWLLGAQLVLVGTVGLLWILA